MVSRRPLLRIEGRKERRKEGEEERRRKGKINKRYERHKEDFPRMHTVQYCTAEH
jgi:hypothetical protein